MQYRTILLLKWNQQKDKLLGSDISLISGNSYSIHYSIFNKVQSRETNFSGYFLKPKNDLSIYGGGFVYRFYKYKAAKGMYWGIGINLSKVKWDYKTSTFSENVQSTLIYPRIERGYRWSFKNGLSLVPNLIFNYKTGEVKAKDGEQRLEKNNSNYSLSLGLDIDFLF